MTIASFDFNSFILHNPEPYILRGETKHFEKLEEMKQKGFIKAYGVSVDRLDELQMILDYLQIDVVEVMFNIIHQEPKEAFIELAKRNIAIIVKIPFDSGWLTGKYTKDSTFTGIRARWDKQTIETRAQIVSDIQAIVNQESLVSTALSFIKSFSEVTTIIPGIKSIEQLDSNIEAIESTMSSDIKTQLENYYQSTIKNLYVPW